MELLIGLFLQGQLPVVGVIEVIGEVFRKSDGRFLKFLIYFLVGPMSARESISGRKGEKELRLSQNLLCLVSGIGLDCTGEQGLTNFMLRIIRR